MTLNKLVEVLNNQKTNGIKSQDWNDLRKPLIVEKADYTHVDLEKLEICFCFDKDTGQLIGAYNYKQ